MIIAQIGLMAKLNIRLIPQSESQIGWVRTLGEFFSSAPLPLFLLANFAVIFQKREKWRYLLMFYGGVALLLYIVGNFVVLHFVYGLVNAFSLGSYNKMALANGVDYFLFGLGHTGLVFNIYFVLGISLSISFKPMDEFIPDASNAISKFAVDSIDFGKASILFLVAPITILFSYTKTHKNKKIDSFIPVTGVTLIAIVYIETLFQILVSNISIQMEKLADFIQNLPF